MNTKLKSRWVLDAALFSGLILACFVGLTGVTLHQWLGIVLGVGAVVHLLTHRTWVTTVANRFFGRVSAMARVYFLIDAALLAGFAIMVATGLVISTWLALDLANYAVWRNVHVMATVATLLVTVVKLALHRKWIVQVAQKWTPVAIPPAAPQNNPSPNAISRRAFLRMAAGAAGVATVLAVTQSLSSLSAVNSLISSASADSSGSSAVSTGSDATSAAASTSASSASSASQSATTTCQVRCNRRCAYPGKCHRYTDSNGNGRRDLGECA